MLIVETEREEDRRWIAEVTALPGVMTYGATREEAVAKAEALALRVLAERDWREGYVRACSTPPRGGRR